MRHSYNLSHCDVNYILWSFISAIMYWPSNFFQQKFESWCGLFFLLIFMLSTHFQETRASCRPRFTTMMVHFEDCIPTRVLARRCLGQCSHDIFGEQTECCVPTRTVERHVRIYCPNSSVKGQPRYVPVIKTVTLPIACGCQDCPPND